MGREEAGWKELQPTALPELQGEALDGRWGLSGEATRSKQILGQGNWRSFLWLFLFLLTHGVLSKEKTWWDFYFIHYLWLASASVGTKWRTHRPRLLITLILYLPQSRRERGVGNRWTNTGGPHPHRSSTSARTLTFPTLRVSVHSFVKLGWNYLPPHAAQDEMRPCLLST